MPNWSSNALIITGTRKNVRAFKATLKLKDSNGCKAAFSFHQTVPMPEDILRGDLGGEEMKKPNWYNWGIENWGTKWDACDVKVEKTDKEIKVWFDTAWAPPIAWLEAVAVKFPNLRFELAYNECGMEFYGVAEGVEGIVTDNCSNYSRGSTDEGCNPMGVLKNHVDHYGLGMGG